MTFPTGLDFDGDGYVGARGPSSPKSHRHSKSESQGEEEGSKGSCDEEEENEEDIKLVPVEERLRQGKMEKQVIGSKGLSWQVRSAVMCCEYLAFCKVDDPKEYVIDYIPLHEIQSVSIQAVPSDPYEIAKIATIEAEMNRLRDEEGVPEHELRDRIEQMQPPIKPDADAVHAAQAKEIMEERLLIQTIDFGHNSGRPYIHRLPDNDAHEWLKLLNTQVLD